MAREIIIQQPIDRASLEDVVVGLAKLLFKNRFVFCRRGIQDISNVDDVPLVFPMCLYGDTQKYIGSLRQRDSFLLTTRLALSSGFLAGRLKVKYKFKPETDEGVLDFIITDNDEYVPYERMEYVKNAVETYFSGLNSN